MSTIPSLSVLKTPPKLSKPKACNRNCMLFLEIAFMTYSGHKRRFVILEISDFRELCINPENPTRKRTTISEVLFAVSEILSKIGIGLISIFLLKARGLYLTIL